MLGRLFPIAEARGVLRRPSVPAVLDRPPLVSRASMVMPVDGVLLMGKESVR